MSEEEEQNRFSLRKLSIGLASVLIGVSIFSTSQTVKADTVADQNTSAVTSNAQSSDTQENKNAVKSSFSSDNQANNVKSNLIQTQVEGKKDRKQDSVPKTQEATDSSNLDAEKSIVRTSSLQEPDNQSNNHAEDNSQSQNEQKLDLTKNSKKLAIKVLATNLIETNNKLTHSYTKQGSDPSVVKTPPKSLLASDNFDYSGTTTIQWNPKMTKGIADSIVSNIHVNPSDPSYEGAYSNSNIDGVVAIASTTLTGNNYIIDPKTGKQTRIAKMNRVFYDLKHAHTSSPLPLQVTIDTTPSSIPYNAYIYGGADQLSEYIEYFDDKNNKINIPLAYDTQIIGSLDGNSQNNERVSGVNGSVVYPYNENAMFLNNDSNTNTVAGNTNSGEAIAIGGLTNGLTFSTTTDWGGMQWTMGLATPSQMQNLPYSEIDTRGVSRNIHFVDEDGNQIQPTLTQTASWVSVKDKQGNIKTIGNQPNIAEYNIPHELTVNGKTYLIDAFTDGNSTKLASWTPANTDKNQDVYLVYKNVVDRHYRIVEKTPDGQSKILYDLILHWEPTSNGYSVLSTDDFTVLATSNNVQQVKDSNGVGDPSYLTITPDKFDNYNVKLESAMYYENGVGFYYDNNLKKYVFDVQSGNATSYKTIQSDTDFIIAYTKNITDPSQLQTTGKRTITITLPHKNKTMTIIQTVGYKRTGTFDTYTKQSTYTDWVFDADTSNVTVDGQPSTQYQAYVLKDGVVNYAPIKLPHINGYKVKLIQDKANPAMFMVSFVAVPTETKPSNPVEVAPSKPSANADNTNKPADDLKDLKQRVVTELNSNDSGWTMPTTADTHVIEVPTDSVSIDLSNLVIAEPVHAQTRVKIRVNKRFKLSKKHSLKHFKHRKKAVRTFKKYRL